MIRLISHNQNIKSCDFFEVFMGCLNDFNIGRLSMAV